MIMLQQFHIKIVPEAAAQTDSDSSLNRSNGNEDILEYLSIANTNNDQYVIDRNISLWYGFGNWIANVHKRKSKHQNDKYNYQFRVEKYIFAGH